MKNNFVKLALIVALGSGFALAQSTPQQNPQSPLPGSSSPTTSPSSTDPQQPSTQPPEGKNPANAPESMPSTDQKHPGDAAPTAATGDLQNTIQTALQKEPTLASANVSVNVKNGNSIELSGTVPTKDAKDTAERIAKENANGMKVTNHIKVAAADKGSMGK